MKSTKSILCGAHKRYEIDVQFAHILHVIDNARRTIQMISYRLSSSHGCEWVREQKKKSIFNRKKNTSPKLASANWMSFSGASSPIK